MKFIEGLGYIFIFSFIYTALQAFAISKGYDGDLASADVIYIGDCLILAGTLASDKS